MVSKKSTNTTSKTKKKITSAFKGVQLVIPIGENGWVVKNSLAKKFTAITDNKKDAVEIATTIAKNKMTSVVIHGRDGSSKEISYAAKG